MTDELGSTELGETRLAPAISLPDRQIGPYRLLEQIGEGGFGAVFIAEQSEPVRRRVAVKVIKLGMDSKAVIARFEAERQALAMMDHPHIASVFDGGTTTSGLPYFVMELVKGEPITTFCDKRGLSIRERLTLFDQVCSAVQHAHGKGIIHRDIKPTNVLVGTRDDQPFAKVIDFGIAKAMTQRLTDATVYTVQHQLIGTPEYMSPEQAAGSADIDTRTDVYALGMMLYELLTGGTPFESEVLRSGGEFELQRIIRDVEPPRPSVRLSRGAGGAVPSSSLTPADARSRAAIIKGELDWIVMKAIEKDRRRRYETANALAMDVRRYLAGEPVLAAPPSTSYRLKKLVRRHKVAATTGALIAASLVLGLIGTTLGMLRAERQRRAADEIAGFMKEILEGVTPSVALGRDTTMLKEMMMRAASRIERGAIADAPDAETELRISIGKTEMELGMFQEAERLIAPSVDLARKEFGSRDPRLASALDAFGLLRTDQGKFADAEPLLREALGIREARFGRQSAEVAHSLGHLGQLLVRSGKGADAEPVLQEALAIRRSLGQTETEETGTLIGDLGLIQRQLGRPADAEAAYRESAAIFRRVGGPDNPDVVTSLSNLSRVLADQKKFAEAEAASRESLAIARKVFGDRHWRVSAVLLGLASALQSQGQLDEAESMIREAVAIAKAGLGDRHLNVGSCLHSLAIVLRRQNKLAEAGATAREAISIVDESAPNSDNAATYRIELGQALIGLKEFARAGAVLAEADRIQQKRPNTAPARRRACFQAFVQLYTAWDNAQPGQGHEAATAAWQQKLDAVK